MKFKRYILLYTLIPLLVLTVSSTYYRFFVLHDYIVAYEGECNPSESSCFVGCEDEECKKEYYYTKIQRHAVDLINLCGENIAGCKMANTCSMNENTCSIEYCNSENGDDCKILDQANELVY